MEIVKPTPTTVQIWHFSLDYWLQSSSTFIGGLGAIVVLALLPVNVLMKFFFLVAIAGFYFFYFCIFLADQSIISYCCFKKREGSVELRRRKLLFQQDAIEIPLVEIVSIGLDEITIEYSWFSFGLFNEGNARFEWHNTNPVAALIGFFTGQLNLYQIYFVTEQIEKIHLTCYETDILGSKRKLVARLSSWLEKERHKRQKLSSSSATLSSASSQSSGREQTLEKWQRAIVEDADNAEAHYQLGLAFYRNRQRQEASFHLKRARDLFEQQNNRQKAVQVQEYLWQSGLD